VVSEANDDGGQIVNGHPDREDKRREARYPTNDSANVSIAPYEQSYPAKILNVSRHGLKLELGRPLPNRVDIRLTTAGVVIFGEVRYCHQIGELFHVGILTRDAIFAKPPAGEHIDHDRLALYIAGQGLSAPEVLSVKEHLAGCAKCRAALAETAEVMHHMEGRLPAES
jgi:hypothetical protein